MSFAASFTDTKLKAFFCIRQLFAPERSSLSPPLVRMQFFERWKLQEPIYLA
jgi:hypothetical protein